MQPRAGSPITSMARWRRAGAVAGGWTGGWRCHDGAAPVLAGHRWGAEQPDTLIVCANFARSARESLLMPL